MAFWVAPVIAAAVSAAAGAGGSALSNAVKDKYNPGPAWGSKQGKDGHVGGYDPNAWQYRGGGGMGAEQRSTMYDQRATDAQKREAAQANYDAAREWNKRGLGDENEGLGLLREAAKGGAPSLAERQLNVGLDAAMRSQESMRASARGAAGVAMADYGAAANIAAAQQDVNRQAGLLRVQEMTQARDAYAQMAGAARGRDIAAAGMEGQWSQFNTEQQMRQREMNDRMTMGMYGLSEGVSSQQLQANMAHQGALQRAYEEAERMRQAREAGQAAAANQAISMGLGGASGAFNALGAAYGASGGFNP